MQTIEERFWSRVNRANTSGCWPWTAYIRKDGYGVFVRREGDNVVAHRMAWELTNGPVPHGREITRNCPLRHCCNPLHLLVGQACEGASLEERFWEKVDKRGPDDCWEWTGARWLGYGSFGGPEKKAHRMSWVLAHGPIPKGLFACHKCDNRPCVNPNHLFLGTCGDNVRDSVKKGRFVSTKKGEGHCKSVLTDAIVREIRLLHSRGVLGTEMAEQFHASTCTISAVITGKTWAHVV